MKTQLQGDFLHMVASSRVRMARNFKEYPFGKISTQTKQEMANKVWQAIETAPAFAQGFTRIDVEPNTVQAQALVEQHVISPFLAKEGGMVFLHPTSGISLMIGEEDHIRLQVLGRGLCIDPCLQEAQRVMHLLEEQLSFAFDAQLGYLTACPTNVGTGLRISVMLHLPILTLQKQMDSIVHWAGKNGCTVRGIYGEGSKAEGAFYQLSNQVTLGVSAQTLCKRIHDMAQTLIGEEQNVRQKLYQNDPEAFLDPICRAVGMVSYARKMTTQEAESCLSSIRMGLQMEFLQGPAPQTLDQCLEQIGPASLAESEQQLLSSRQRDEKRASLLRTQIGRHLTIVC